MASSVSLLKSSPVLDKRQTAGIPSATAFRSNSSFLSPLPFTAISCRDQLVKTTGKGYRSKRSSLLTIGGKLVLRASITENKATRRESVALTLMVATSTTVLGLQAAIVASPVVATENWGTRSFIKERFFQMGLSPEEAVARIKNTNEGLHAMRPMLDTMSWRYVIFYIRLKSAYLSSDLKNALLTLPESPRRASYIKIANELVDNMAELDYYVRTPKVYESYLYYEKTLKSLDDLVALL